MNKAKKFVPVLTAVLVTAVALCAMPKAVNANAMSSGFGYRKGVTASGAVVIGENCPVEIKSEVLTFNVPDLIDHSSTKEQLLNYRADFSAEYTLKNPDESVVTATLAFPMGRRSTYGYYEKDDPQDGTDEWRESYVHLDDVFADRYKVLVEGEEIQTQLRHTYHINDEDFVAESKRLYDEYRPHEFFNSEMPVYKYKFIINSKEEESFTAKVTVNYPDGVRFAGTYGHIDFNSDKAVITYYAREAGEEIDLYSIGGQLDCNSLEWRFYRGSLSKPKDVEAKAELVPEIEITTFENYVFEGYTGGNGVSKCDFYNAVLDYIDHNSKSTVLPDSSTEMLSADYEALEGSSRLMGWLIYEVELDAGQTVKNTVTAPLFPGFYNYYKPTVYNYEFAFSSAQNLNGLESFEIRVNTPYYVLNSNFKFEKTEYGYCYKANELPQESLIFEVCTVEDPVNNGNNLGVALAAVFVVIIAIPTALCLGFAIWGIVVLVKGEKSKF